MRRRGGTARAATADALASPFLALGAGARAAALGQAYTAIADDATTVHWNPAGLPDLPRQNASFTHAGLMGGAFAHDRAAWGRPWGKNGGVGLDVQHLGAGALDRVDGTGTVVGGFTPRDVAAALAFARRGRAGAIGVAAKWIQRRVDDSARTFAGDVGLLTPFFFGNRVRFGAAAANLGGRLRFGDETESVSPVYRAGLVARGGPFTFVTIDGEKRGGDTSVRAGLEHAVEGARGGLALRVGYDGALAADDGPGGLGGGIGVGFRNIKIDYALVPVRGGQMSHWATVSTWF